MTAVPGVDARTTILICDACGADQTTVEMTHDSDVVWPLMGPLGWTGSPFATGRHHCPPCSVEPPALPSPRPADTAQLHGAAYDLHVLAELDLIVIAPLTDIDADSSGVLKEALGQATQSHRHVLVDMRAAGVIDSAGLGLLVRARQDARQRGGTLALAAPSRYVLTVLHTMRLERVFDVFADTTAALDSYRRA
ncbi:STAS domain-containing protein [Actinoplanes sp. NPDC024001]|uniref:STAS domain-containing protein n=1 Tax=Actinoplanes sp. NPDC024001 TaxID=3154598 RepID=UPI0033C9DEE2